MGVRKRSKRIQLRPMAGRPHLLKRMGPRCTQAAQPIPVGAGGDLPPFAAFVRRRRLCVRPAASENSLEHLEARQRSEEHTSEPQSLMRISYAGFCLKKKKTN